MKLSDLLDPVHLDDMLTQGYVRKQTHPSLPLAILNYTEAATYERVWNDVTMQCRGLIYNTETGEIAARPFRKFMNYGEPGPLGDIELDPNEPVIVTDKLDGCFPRGTALNLWGGGTIRIERVVRDQLPVTLIGMNAIGDLVPSRVVDWHHNGRKDHWCDIKIASPVSRLTGAAGLPNRLRVTVNHHLYVNGAYRPACEVRPGDTMVTQSWTPDEHALRMIRASLLGDGCLVSSRTRPSQAKYQESHVSRYVDYVYAIRKALGDCAAIRSDTVSGYGSDMIWVGSREYESLGVLRAEWYPEGIKCVPTDLSWMDDFVVAKWLMDDGHRQQFAHQADRIGFSTHSFQESDVRRLGDRLVDLYGISYHLVNDHGRGWVLVINSGRQQQIRTLWALVAPYVHPSMRYKLPEEFRDRPYVEPAPGRELTVPRKVSVLSVTPVAATKRNFPHGRTGFDITTETRNYFARGVLVHNSLGVLYDDGDGGAIATRGSFTSEQAIHATKVWKQRYVGHLPQNDVTLLFEIIYPQNRIVCDYGNSDDLYLLAAVYLLTGEVWRPSSATKMNWSGPIVERFPYATLAEALAAPPREGVEGLVVDLVNRDERVKIKQADYVQLHRIITGCTARRLWEYLAVHACAAHGGVEFLVRRLMMAPDRIEEILAAGPDWQERFLRNTPEEFSDWVFDRITGMIGVANLRRAEITREYEIARADAGEDRKTFALAVKDRPDAGALFGLLQDREIDTFIWRELRPEHELPYRRIDESVA